jgi:hypothetical protein
VRLLGKVHQAPHDKTSKPGTSQAMKWTWLQEAQGPTREDGKLRELGQKMLNLARQGASSKLWRNWHQRRTCRRENTLEGSESNTTEGGRGLGRSGPRPTGPVTPPFDIAAIRTIYSPGNKSHTSILHHTPPRSREDRDTISERRGSS